MARSWHFGFLELCLKGKILFITLEKISLQLYTYFKKEASRGRLYQAISEPEKRVQHALGLSKSTLKRWIKDNDKDEFLTREREKKKAAKPN